MLSMYKLLSLNKYILSYNSLNKTKKQVSSKKIDINILSSKKIDIDLWYIKNKNRSMQLTKAEEQIMQILWNIGEGTVQDILKEFSDNKPARTTIATILSILEGKNFVEHHSEGRTNIYKALIAKEEYSKKQLFGFVRNYFDGSFSSMISFFAKETNLSVEDMDKLMRETRKALEEENNRTK